MSPLTRNHLNSSHRFIKYNHIDTVSQSQSKTADVEPYSPYSPTKLPPPAMKLNSKDDLQAQSSTQLLKQNNPVNAVQNEMQLYDYQITIKDLNVNPLAADHNVRVFNKFIETCEIDCAEKQNTLTVEKPTSGKQRRQSITADILITKKLGFTISWTQIAQLVVCVTWQPNGVPKQMKSNYLRCRSHSHPGMAI